MTHKFDLDTTLEQKDDETCSARPTRTMGRTRTARAALADAWTLVLQARQLGALMGR